MHNSEKTKKPAKTHNHDNLLLLLCFLTTALIGYILTHQVSLFGA